MMSMNPRNLPAYAMPAYHLSDVVPIESKPAVQNQSLAPLFIQAADFTKSVNANNYEWKIIEGLGYSNSSVTLFPFDNHMFDNKAPFLQYNFDVEKTGKYEIEIRCLPTHSNNFDHKLWVEIDGNILEASSLNTRGRSKA